MPSGYFDLTPVKNQIGIFGLPHKKDVQSLTINLKFSL
jgi:hypothetical protein